VFRIISLAGVSVDLVATSETTTTLAINAAANHLDGDGTDALVQALAACCSVTKFSDCSCVNLVGRGARSALAGIGASTDFFRDRPLLMLSQSANDLSISLLVEAQDAGALVSILHDRLIGDSHARSAAFGPTWSAVKSGG
jgi:aspartokinase